jgi:hypothetical protein
MESCKKVLRKKKLGISGLDRKRIEIPWNQIVGINRYYGKEKKEIEKTKVIIAKIQ